MDRTEDRLVDDILTLPVILKLGPTSWLVQPYSMVVPILHVNPNRIDVWRLSRYSVSTMSQFFAWYPAIPSL